METATEVTVIDAVTAAAAIVMPATIERARLVRAGVRNVVVRARLRASDDSVTGIVIKRLVRHTALGFTDWASLEFLGAIAPGLAPRFIGGDASASVFVMQDLGGSRSLDDVLSGSSRAHAVAGLASMAVATARLHAATASIDESEFLRLRARLPGLADVARAAHAERWLAESVPRFIGWLESVGLAASPELDTSLRAVAREYAAPSDFLAFTQGDPAPSNTHLRGSRVRLLDFEYGGYRHALYDPTSWTILCPLPDESADAVRTAYRAELARHIDVAADDRRFAEGWSRMWAYRAVALLSWIPSDALRADGSWVESWTMREAALTAAMRLERAAAGDRALAPLALAASALASRFAARWPEAARHPLPRWRSLGTDSDPVP